MIRTATGLAVAGLLLVLPTSDLRAQGTIDQTRTLSRDGAVEVENLAGSVRVRAWDRNEVRVTGTLGRNVEGVDVDGSANRVSIRVRHPRRSGSWRGSGTDLEIRMPAGARLRVEGVSADIDVQGINGTLDLESVSGDVDIRDGNGRVRAESVSGTVHYQGSSNDLSLAAVSGDVRVSGVDGAEIRASSVSGDVEVDGGNFRDGTFETVSGSVTFRGALSRDGSFEFESHSGRVLLELTAPVHARFDLSTFSGDIRGSVGGVNVADQVQRTSRWTPGQEGSFRVGEGTADVRASSFSGSVEIRERR
jgi:DUF4097 and DUF4098 domain-containing protein YvlB